MTRILITVLLSCISLFCFAQKQQGLVRTIGTAKHRSKPISGAVIKLKGKANSVESNRAGSFSLSMNGKKEGDSYQLLNVIKSGYEIADKDFLSCQFAYSPKISLEVVMISSKELAESKQEIESKAYETISLKYKEQVELLEREVNNGAISAAVYYKKLDELQKQYDHFEILISEYAEYYARLDFDRMDSIDASINSYIISGELEKAEELLSQKGNLNERINDYRERKEKHTQAVSILDSLAKNLDIQKAQFVKEQNEIANDLHNKHFIALAKFDMEAAREYIELRAMIDTMNVSYQLQASNFIKYYYNYEDALPYVNRAYNIAVNQYGKHSYKAALCLANKASLVTTDEDKLFCLQESFTIVDSLPYNTNKLIASLYSTMGVIASEIKEDSIAAVLFDRVVEYFEENDPQNEFLSSAYNNRGTLKRSHSLYEQAITDYEKSLNLLQAKYNNNNPKIAWVYERIGTVETLQRKFEEGQKHLLLAKSGMSKAFPDNNKRMQSLYLSLGMTSVLVNDWGEAYSCISKVVDNEKSELLLLRTDSLKNKKLEEIFFYEDILRKSMDSLKISDGKQELLEDMYYIQNTLGINGDKGYTISISLGNLYFDKEVFDKALACYQTSLRALQTGNGKKYRFDIASNNIYVTFMELFGRGETEIYREKYKDFLNNADFVIEIEEEECPAKEKGLSGTYHLLKYNDWELDSEKSIFTENKNREGKGKKVILCKNNEIEQFYFEDRIGGTIEIKYIDESDKQYLIQLYKSYIHSTE